jgi:hypothetical protein
MSTDLGQALDAMRVADPGYRKAVAYSEGPVSEVFASRRLRRLLRDKGVNFQALLGDVIIDAVANKLKVTAITSDTDARTAKIAAVDEANEMALVRPAVMRRALQQGDSYLSAWPVLDDNGDVVPGKIRVDVHDARIARLIYDAENPTEPKLGIQKWAFGKRVRVDLLYPDRLEHFITRVDNGSAAAPDDFEPYSSDGRDAVEANPYGQIPMFHFHGTGLPGEYGCPEHKSFYGTQDTLLKLKIGHMSSVDYHALPQRVALRDAGTLTSTPDELDEDEFMTSQNGERTQTKVGDAKSTLSSEPGSVWDLAGYKDVKQLDPGDPAAFLDPAAYYLKEGSTASSTPLHLFDRTGQIPSGEALKTANEPLDTKSAYRKMSFDSTMRRFYVFVLMLLGEAEAPVSIAWAPIESTDETTKLAQAAQKLDVGIPAEVALTELGYGAELVQAWLADGGDGGLPARMALVVQFADAMGALAPAVAAGVVTQEQVQVVVDQLIGDLDNGGNNS